MIREPIYKSTPLRELRPTQITVGMKEVEEKRRRWRDKHGVKAGEFLASHMIPVVLGPKGRRYVTDHHHLARALYDTTQEVCAAYGLPAYEISNHARPGGESRHNLIYWRAHEYAGIGPGAHGRLEFGGQRHAIATERAPEAWLKRVETLGQGIVTDELLTREEIGDEYLLMGLRLAEGIDLARYAAVSGRPLDPARVAALYAHGLIETTKEGRLRVTLSGFPVLDAVVADLAA